MPPPERRRRAAIGALTASAAGVGLAAATASEAARSWLRHAWSRWRGGFSVEQRLAEHGGAVRARLAPRLAAAGLGWPPRELTLLAIKDQRLLEVHARDDARNPWQRIATYSIRGASGGPGPKLREGDRQVPEGLYRAAALNPNSRFHLSIRLDYPNAFDRRMAALDGRERLGGDVMIHGNAYSAGCLAMGNRAAEDLFVLAALVGLPQVRILIAPTDFRDPRRGAKGSGESGGPAWLPVLYGELRAALRGYAAPAADPRIDPSA
jgi:hypothetical protein